MSSEGLAPSLDPSPVDANAALDDVLGTNNPPNELNLAAVRGLVSQSSLLRATMNARLSSLKAETEKILEDRKALDAQIRRYQGALSPLRRYPTELLSLIFTFAVHPMDYESDLEDFGLMGMRMRPWTLAAVCGRWRNIVLSQSNLWAFLCLDFQDFSRGSHIHRSWVVPMVEAHLNRSRNESLVVIFRMTQIRLSETEQRVLELIAPHSHRWERIIFCGPPALYNALSNLKLDFSMLRALDVSLSPDVDVTDEGMEDYEVTIDNFSVCPNVERVFINLNVDSGSKVPIKMNLGETKNLRIYSATNSWEYHSDILRYATNVSECWMGLTHSLPLVAETLLLPMLRRLSITTTGVLDFLEAPALEELYHSYYTPQLCTQLARGKFPKLWKLFIGARRQNIVIDWDDFLSATRTVTHLYISLSPQSASGLFAILEGSTGQTIPTTTGETDQEAVDGIASAAITLPTLHTLALNFDMFEGDPTSKRLDEDQLLRVLEAQWVQGQMRSFRMYGRVVPKLRSSTLEQIETLRRDGFDIVLERFPMMMVDGMADKDSYW
ncbi:hypothetical protein R3P38DRAFT_1054996 [Favolaschia claudopus]|uniref:F-box domain-containing protein n=1 Tax=Favolaschia claudopus TaxID=2862362 RepID=A0AAW0BF96_9AGAR